jgi:hypothetical protein
MVFSTIKLANASLILTARADGGIKTCGGGAAVGWV